MIPGAGSSPLSNAIDAVGHAFSLESPTQLNAPSVGALLNSLRAHAHDSGADSSDLHVRLTREELEQGVRLVLSDARHHPLPVLADVIAYAAMLRLGSPETYAAAARQTAERMHEFDPASKDLSKFCWALGHACASDSAFWRAAAGFVRAHSSEMKPKWFCTIAEAAAMTGSQEPELFGALAKAILENRDELSKSGLQRARHAFNSIDLTDRRILSEVVGAPLPSIDKCAAAERALILDVLLNLGVRDNPVTHKLTQRMAGELMTAPIRDITNDVKRLMQLKHRPDWYFGALAAVLENRINECQGTDVVVFARALSVHPPRNREVFCSLSERAVTLSGERKFSLSNIIDTLECFSRVSYVDRSYLEMATKQLANGCAHVRSEDLVRSAEGFARLREPAEPFFKACRAELLKRLDAEPLSGDTISRALLAYGELRQDPGEFLDQGVRLLTGNGGRCGTADLSRATYAALMISDDHATRLFECARAQCATSSDELDGALSLFMYWSAQALGQELPSALQERAQSLIQDMSRKLPVTNAFEQRVAETLRGLGHAPVMQVPLHGYVIDMTIESGGQRWAIECDGSHVHQVGRVFSDRMLGRYVVRDKVLARAGYKVIHISNEEEEAFRHELPSAIQARLAA